MQTLTLARCFAGIPTGIPCAPAGISRIPAGASRTCLLACFLMLLACWHTQAHAQTVTPLPASLYPTQNQLTGLFYNPAESGYGCNSIAQANPKFAQNTVAMPESRNILFVTCFIYDAQGKPAWVVASDVRDVSSTGSYRGLLYRTSSAGFGVNFNPNAVGVTAVGEIELNFAKVFDVKLLLRIKDPQALLIVNGNQDNTGAVTVVKNVKRQVWGNLPATVEYTQESIIPQGVQMKVPSVELAATCTRTTDTCFYLAVQSGTVLLIDTGVKRIGAPDPTRDIIYAVYRQNGRLFFKQMHKDDLTGAFPNPPFLSSDYNETRISMSSSATGFDRVQGSSSGMLIRAFNSSINQSECLVSNWQASSGTFGNDPSNACPVWN